MKLNRLWAGMAVVLMMTAGGQDALAQEGARLDADLEIEGMVCPLCQRSVVKTLEEEPGVFEAAANFRTGQAAVTYDPAVTDLEQLVESFNARSFYRARIPTAKGDSASGTGAVWSLDRLGGSRVSGLVLVGLAVSGVAMAAAAKRHIT